MVTRSARGCRLYVEPPGLSAYGMFDLSRGAEIQTIGHAYTARLLKERTR